LKQTGLKKLLKKMTLADMLVDLEKLSGDDFCLGIYDLDNQHLAGSTAISPEEIINSLQTDQAPPAGGIRVLLVHGEALGYLVASGKLALSQLEAAAGLLTRMLAHALEKRALAQETLERYREINLLYKIQQAIGDRPELSYIAHMVLQESIRVIKAESGVLLAANPDQLSLDVLACYGQTPIQKRCPLTASIAGWVLRSQQAVIVNDTATDPRCGPADTEARSLVCVPLTVGVKDIGVLMLYDKIASDIFTASDKKLLAALASSAAIAIETIRETEANENRLKAQIRQLRIQVDEIHKQNQVDSIVATDYFARLQQTAQEMRQEFQEGL
jgi:transcriptional regulator with GAF, ATPase, and Fis domain